MVFLLFAGHGLDFKSLEPAALGKVMAALYFCSMSITLAGILCYRRARGGSGPWARFSARGLNPALLLWAFVLMFAVGVAPVVFQTLPQHIIHAGVVEIRHAQQDNSRTDISSRLNIGHIIWADSQSLRRLLLGHTSRPAECLNPFSDSFCINHHHTPFQVQCIV